MYTWLWYVYLCSIAWSVWGNHVFNDRLSVEIRSPVDQVETAKKHRKDDAGHAVNLAYAVKGLLALFSHRLSFNGLCWSALWNSGQSWILANVGCIVCHSNCISIVLLYNRAFFFLWTCCLINILSKLTNQLRTNNDNCWKNQLIHTVNTMYIDFNTGKSYLEIGFVIF